MQLEKNGKLIKDIKIYKQTIALIFDGERMSISKKVFEDNYPFIGKFLTNEDIKKIKSENDLEKHLKYALNMTSKRRYSEYEIKQKLYAHNAKTLQISVILEKLRKLNLVNDQELTNDLIEIENEKCYGKEHILRSLKNKHLPAENLEEKFTYEAELNKALKQVKSLCKKYAKKSNKLKENHIYLGLKNLGFEDVIIEDTMSNLKFDKDSEISNLKNDFKMAILRNESKVDDKILEMKIKSILMSKGYELEDINELWEGYTNENGFRNY